MWYNKRKVKKMTRSQIKRYKNIEKDLFRINQYLIGKTDCLNKPLKLSKKESEKIIYSLSFLEEDMSNLKLSLNI